MKHKDTRLSESRAVRGRYTQSEILEMRRLDIKEELEKLMNEYAKLTGKSELKRKQPIGSAPNDWRREDHKLV